jgi:hypothetical protein
LESGQKDENEQPSKEVRLDNWNSYGLQVRVHMVSPNFGVKNILVEIALGLNIILNDDTFPKLYNIKLFVEQNLGSNNLATVIMLSKFSLDLNHN